MSVPLLPDQNHDTTCTCKSIVGKKKKRREKTEIAQGNKYVDVPVSPAIAKFCLLGLCEEGSAQSALLDKEAPDKTRKE